MERVECYQSTKHGEHQREPAVEQVDCAQCTCRAHHSVKNRVLSVLVHDGNEIEEVVAHWCAVAADQGAAE